MNKRHVQTFLMVSAAFFAMSAPLRPNAAGNAAPRELARAASRQIVPVHHTGLLQASSSAASEEGERKA